MRLANPFTMPETDPVVPERLAERITNLLPHTVKIIVMQHTLGGWRVVNTVYMDGGEEASEVYTIVKAAADYHAAEIGQPGKYRAQIWRVLPGKIDPERHAVTFHVRDDDEDDAPSVVDQDRRDQSSGWKDLVDSQQRFVEFMAEYNHRATDRVLEQSKQDAERLYPMADVIHDFVGMYRDGLRMKSDSVQIIAELQSRQQRAEAQAQENGKMWEVFAPAVQMATMHAGQRLFGGGPGKPRALPPGSAPQAVARRREVQTVTATPQAQPSPAAASAPTTPPPEPPRSAPPVHTMHAQAEPPPAVPATLHELAAAVLDSMGADALIRLGRLLDDQQLGFIQAIARASDDDTSAESIAGLMQSLMASPATVVAVQQTMDPSHIAALQQIGALARRHLEERTAQRTEGAPPSSGDAPSAGKVRSGA